MPQVKFTPEALQDLQRLRKFLATKSPSAATRAATAILRAIRLLGLQAQIGRPIEGLDPQFHDLPIHFGATGYIARYHYADDIVTILAIRHQKEAGF